MARRSFFSPSNHVSIKVSNSFSEGHRSVIRNVETKPFSRIRSNISPINFSAPRFLFPSSSLSLSLRSINLTILNNLYTQCQRAPCTILHLYGFNCRAFTFADRDVIDVEVKKSRYIYIRAITKPARARSINELFETCRMTPKWIKLGSNTPSNLESINSNLTYSSVYIISVLNFRH